MIAPPGVRELSWPALSNVPVFGRQLDGEPVELFFMLVGPESASGAHVKALSRISRLLRREQLRNGLRASETSHEFLDIVRASEAI